MIKYGLGCIPDPPDKRDFLLSAFIPLSVTVPSRFSLRSKMTPIKHQGGLGSCVAFATNAVKEYFDAAEMCKEIDLSEQFLYGECKKIDGFPGTEGTTARAAFTTMSKTGVCEEQYFPYEGCYPPKNSPKSGYLTNAEVFKIKTYVSAAGGVDMVKQALYQNGPMSLAVIIFDSFMKSRYNGGFVPEPTGAQLGGHLMCVVGYDDNKEWGGYKGFLEVRNSWGKDYGDSGYVWIPYSVYNQIGVGSQWTIVDITTTQKHWSDWPNQELEAQNIVYNSGLIKGYPDGTVRPWENLLRRHVALVMQRLNMSVDTSFLEDYTETTRGWVRDSFPFLTWNEERWDEPLSRYQFILLLARYLDSINTIC